MATILVIMHTQADGALPTAAREVLGAARAAVAAWPAATLKVGLLGGDVNGAAEALAACGAAETLAVSGPDFAVSRYATDVAAMAALIRAAGADIVLAPATARLARAAAGAAARVSGVVDTHITGLDVENGAIKAHRWYYRQRMEAVFSRTQRPWVLLVESGVAPAWEGTPGKAAVSAVDAALTPADTRTEVLGIERPPADAQTIRPDARLLFVAGAGWTKKQADGQPHVDQAADLIKGFLGATQASLGSSKSLVDLKTEGQQTLGFMSHLNQVGQTGSTPRHPKGLATCCHGEEPHVVGWRFITERRAINTDPNCGWAQGKADVLYVADAFAVMRALNARLS